MANIQARLDIIKAAKKRAKSLSFGQPVTNVCAGDKNPMLHCYFVEYKNGYARCTDKKGKFWNIEIPVIYPGHLFKNTRNKLFSPVWEAAYGKPAK